LVDTLSLGPLPVWSAGSTTTTLFHAFTKATNSNLVQQVLVSFDLRQSSGDLTLRAAFQYSDDGIVWSTPVEFGPAFSSTEETTYGTAFTDVTVLGARKVFIRLGVVVKNDGTSTEVEFGVVRLRLDFQ